MSQAVIFTAVETVDSGEKPSNLLFRHWRVRRITANLIGSCRGQSPSGGWFRQLKDTAKSGIVLCRGRLGSIWLTRCSVQRSNEPQRKREGLIGREDGSVGTREELPQLGLAIGQCQIRVVHERDVKQDGPSNARDSGVRSLDLGEAETSGSRRD